MMLRQAGHALRVVLGAIRERKKRKNRSPLWDDVQRDHLKVNPYCAACGGMKRLQVHHIKPFHHFPELELVLSNLITLCMGRDECHLRIGHGGNYKTWNPNVERHAEAVLRYPDLREVILRQAKAQRLSEPLTKAA